MKRPVVLTVVGFLVYTVASIAEYRGPLQPVNPDIDVIVQGSSEWGSADRPNLAGHLTDTDGVYVMLPQMPSGDKFAAVRVSASTGAQSLRNIAIGPSTGFRDCYPPKSELQVVVRGLRFNRVAWHAFRFPAGQGPGFHYSDSATGRIDVRLRAPGGPRTVLRQRVYNSEGIGEIVSSVCVERTGHWAATTMRTPEGRRLVIFRR